MAAINDSVCQYLVNSLDGFIRTLNGARVSLNTTIIMLKTSIRTLQYSALDALQEVEADINNKLGDIVPKVDTKEDLDQLVNIINSCPYLNNHPLFGNPIKMMRSAATAIRQFSIGQTDLLTSAYPEFDIGKTITTLLNQYGPVGFDFTKIIPNCFQIIECIDSLCDNDISDRYLSLTESMNQLYLLTTGGFDRGKLYQDLHLNGNQILNIETGVSTYNNVINTANSEINKSLSYMKSVGSSLGF